MSAFQKFDPGAFRATQDLPCPPAKAAQVANLPATAPRLSRFSSFSSHPGPSCDGEPGSEGRADVEARATLREDAGGLARDGADGLADAVREWLCRNPPAASDPARGCVQCGTSDQHRGELLPMLAPGGHAWVHDRCWAAWVEAREARAREALTRAAFKPSA